MFLTAKAIWGSWSINNSVQLSGVSNPWIFSSIIKPLNGENSMLSKKTERQKYAEL